MGKNLCSTTLKQVRISTIGLNWVSFIFPVIQPPIPSVDGIEVFRHLAYTMGSMIIFPSNRVEGKSTINSARGFHPLIRDRIDLTLECIRRFYLNETSPLSDTLGRYKSFFELFDNFQGYIEFFLFQDLVANDFSTIKFFIPFDNFKTPVIPKTLGAYLAYKSSVINYMDV